jgi:hypothetical protein
VADYGNPTPDEEVVPLGHALTLEEWDALTPEAQDALIASGWHPYGVGPLGPQPGEPPPTGPWAWHPSQHTTGGQS